MLTSELREKVEKTTILNIAHGDPVVEIKTTNMGFLDENVRQMSFLLSNGSILFIEPAVRPSDGVLILKFDVHKIK